jgi:hypothetical protein
VDEDLTPAERLAKQRAQLKKRLGEPPHSSCWMMQGLHGIMTATGCRSVPDSSTVWCTWGLQPHWGPHFRPLKQRRSGDTGAVCCYVCS